MVQTSADTSLSIDSPQGRKLFVFDRVFGPEVEQEGVWDYLSDSVNAFAQGYNVSLLAYGQSGAGKSYTMGTSGPLDQQDDNMMGKPACLLRLCRMRASSPPLPSSNISPQVSFPAPQPPSSQSLSLSTAKMTAQSAHSAPSEVANF